jgi:hypothetical protein
MAGAARQPAAGLPAAHVMVPNAAVHPQQLHQAQASELPQNLGLPSEPALLHLRILHRQPLAQVLHCWRCTVLAEVEPDRRPRLEPDRRTFT